MISAASSVVDTGEFGPWDTRAWISASKADNDSPFNNYGKIDKRQYNGKIWQPIGANGDFVSIAAHYNVNRNNFIASLPLRRDSIGLSTAWSCRESSDPIRRTAIR